jgi:hypothetical protein
MVYLRAFPSSECRGALFQLNGGQVVTFLNKTPVADDDVRPHGLRIGVSSDVIAQALPVVFAIDIPTRQGLF